MEIFNAYISAKSITLSGVMSCRSGYSCLYGGIGEGDLSGAYLKIKEENPFPRICGRCCPHPCESACNRKNFDDPVSINAIERFIGDLGASLNEEPELSSSLLRKESVAIIGSGPAGLSCAYFLAKLGYKVVIYEALPEAGGLLMYGIPEYRLPKDVVRDEIKKIQKLKVEIKTGVRIGKDLAWRDLKGYDAILIATGAWESIKLDVPGGNMAIAGLSFLKQVNSGETPHLGKRVVVIGGGSTAVDCARSALRLGAAEVHIFCLEPRDGMLATPDEIEDGESEGIIIHPSHTVAKILSNDAHVTGIECLDVRCFRFDDEGGIQIDSVRGSEHVLPADTIISAIGQMIDLGLISSVNGITITKRRTLSIDSVTLATSEEGVFVAGDVVTGTASVVEAIAGGRRAAVAIDCYLSGKEAREEIYRISFVSKGGISMERYISQNVEPAPQRKVNYEGLNLNYFEKKPQVKVRCTPFREAIQRFEEVKKGYTEGELVESVIRCFKCGACNGCDNCLIFCPDMAVIKRGDEREADYEYCKGCGICAYECPSGVIAMEEGKQ